MRKYKNLYKHEGKYYTKENRKAKVGELILVTNSVSPWFKNGEVYTVLESFGNYLDLTNGYALRESSYVVLVPYTGGQEITDVWYDETTCTEQPVLVCPYCHMHFDCRKEPYCSHCGEPVYHNHATKQPVPFSKEYYNKPDNSKDLGNITEKMTQAEYDKISDNLWKTVNELDSRTGGLYRSVYVSYAERVLAELKKRIVPEKRKWTDAEIQEAKNIVLSYCTDTKFITTGDTNIIGAYFFNPKTKKFNCATAICMKNDTFDYWIGRMVACLKLHDKQLPEWVKGGSK